MTGRAAYLIVILMALVLGVPNALVGRTSIGEGAGGVGMDAAPTAADALALPAYTGVTRVWNASDLSYVAKVGTQGTGNDQFNAPRGVATDGTYIWVVDVSNNRVVKRLASDLSFVAKIGTGGTGNDQFNYPHGVATDGTYIWVVDTSNHRIVKRLASDLSFVAKVGAYGAGNDQFNSPYGVATDGTYIWVADTYNHRVVKRLASDLSFVAKIGTQGTGNDQFNAPYGVATDGTYIWVADTGNHRVVKRLASDLSFVAKIGTQGTGNDQFNAPFSVATDGTYIWVADTYNHRVVKRLASDLSFVAKIGTQGTGNDQFNVPYGVATDGTYIWVADTSNHRIVKRLASDLSFVAKVGAYGAGNDQFNAPYGVATDGTYIWVADTDNHRIVKRLAYIDHDASWAVNWAPVGVPAQGDNISVGLVDYGLDWDIQRTLGGVLIDGYTGQMTLGEDLSVIGDWRMYGADDMEVGTHTITLLGAGILDMAGIFHNITISGTATVHMDNDTTVDLRATVLGAMTGTGDFIEPCPEFTSTPEAQANILEVYDLTVTQAYWDALSYDGPAFLGLYGDRLMGVPQESDAGIYNISLALVWNDMTTYQNWTLVMSFPVSGVLDAGTVTILMLVFSLIAGFVLLAFGLAFKEPIFSGLSGMTWLFSALSTYTELSIGYAILCLGIGMTALVVGALQYVDKGEGQTMD